MLIVFVVVTCDALAQASDFRIEKRRVVFLCWMQDSNPEGLWNRISSRLNAHSHTDWDIENQAKNLNSTARPYDQQAFSPLDPTAVWHLHLALAIYMFVVVNFDALAQASDFLIERRRVATLCWMQDLNPEGLNFQQTECPMTNLTELSSLMSLKIIYFWHYCYITRGKCVKKIHLKMSSPSPC